MGDFFLWGAIFVLYLLGSLFFWRLRQPSSTSSKLLEKRVNSSLEEIESVRKRLEAEWEEVYGRMLSIAGRMDRANSRTKGRPPLHDGPANESDPLGELNAFMAAQRGIRG